ncbi:hypothetical protein MESS2_940002 [Mesorhizobium metallidurans STM 2683]|uniref:Uncharacterized protein n=1 Tax=Mesorhizobium metallidurans STM 2683 TaxID=1297569 RepID=M5FBF2_9HYPH|nr:hypothetical protein MESS2_940002 [Mesorhizobium metallidurans STM 2683]
MSACDLDREWIFQSFNLRSQMTLIENVTEIPGKTVCPPLPMRWLALHCASEGCSDGPSRSSPQEDEPWRIIEKHLSESMLRSLRTLLRLRRQAGKERFGSSVRSTRRRPACGGS